MKTISVGVHFKTCLYYILQVRNVKTYLHMQSIQIVSLSRDII